MYCFPVVTFKYKNTYQYTGLMKQHWLGKYKQIRENNSFLLIVIFFFLFKITKINHTRKRNYSAHLYNGKGRNSIERHSKRPKHIDMILSYIVFLSNRYSLERKEYGCNTDAPFNVMACTDEGNDHGATVEQWMCGTPFPPRWWFPIVRSVVAKPWRISGK